MTLTESLLGWILTNTETLNYLNFTLPDLYLRHYINYDRSIPTVT